MARDDERFKQEERNEAVDLLKLNAFMSLGIATIPFTALASISPGFTLTFGRLYSSEKMKEIQKKMALYQSIEPGATLREVYEYAKNHPEIYYSKEEYNTFATEYRKEDPHAKFKDIDTSLNWKIQQQAREEYEKKQEEIRKFGPDIDLDVDRPD